MDSSVNKLIEAAKSAVPADFSAARLNFDAGAGQEPSLKAEALRQLLLGLNPPSIPSDFDTGRCLRWKIVGLTVEGRLDLSDARLPNGCPLPALDFVGCIFTGGFCADDAHLERLRFSDCAFGTVQDGSIELSHISLRNARFAGELHFAKLRPITNGGLLCVEASAVRSGANVVFRELTLKAAPNQEMVEPLKTSYGLNLRSAVIRAELFLEPQVSIEGGLMLRGAHIGGDFRATGLRVSDGADNCFRTAVLKREGRLMSAIDAQGARIDGNMLARPGSDETPFKITGNAHFLGINVGGSIKLSGAVFDSGWLNLCNCDISGGIELEGAIANLYASSLSVKGNLTISTMLKTIRSKGLFSAISSFDAHGVVFLDRAVVKGSLKCTSEYVDNEDEKPENRLPSRQGITCLNGCSVGGDLDFEGTFGEVQALNLSVAGDTRLPILAQRRVDLSAANLNGSLDLSHFRFLTLRGFTPKKRQGFWLIDTEIKRALTLGMEYTPDRNIIFERELDGAGLPVVPH